MKARLASVLLALGFAAAAPRAARADDAATASQRLVIAVVGTSEDRFSRRLEAELEAAGFRVIAVDAKELAGAPRLPTRASLDAAAREAGATAAVWAVPSEHGFEVWIADRAGRRALVRELVNDSSAPDQDASLALAAVELVRASLLEVDTTRARQIVPPPPRVVAAPRTAEAPVAATPTTVRLSLEPAVLVGPGGFGPSASLDVGVAWIPSEHLGVAAFAAVPLSHPSVSRSGNSADLSAFLVGGGLRLSFASRSSRWSPTADVGLAAAFVRSTGSASTGFVALTTSTSTAAPYADVGVAYAATANFRARADLLVAVTTKRIVVSFGDERIATWGAPIVMPELGVDFGWF